MNEKQSTKFVELLELFINTCGLDNIDACHKAQELLDIINDK